MSRVRFHALNAIARACDFTGWGIGWEGYDSRRSLPDNLARQFPGVTFDVVEAYRPLEMPGFREVNAIKCVRYNEMYDVAGTRREIEGSGADLVVCHHYNDCLRYREIYRGQRVRFAYIPHSAEQTIFHDQQRERPCDILVVGATHVTTMLGDHYPLRWRVSNLIQAGKFPAKYRAGIFPHVGGEHPDASTDRYAHQFAAVLNQAKIVVTDSGVTRSRFGKYVEIPMCGAVLAADLHDDYPDDVRKLKEYAIVLDRGMSDEEIIGQLGDYLDHPDRWRQKAEAGLAYARDFTQEKYAERFLAAMERYRAGS